MLGGHPVDIYRNFVDGAVDSGFGPREKSSGTDQTERLLADDVDAQLRHDVLVQSHRDQMLSERLDRLVECDALAVHRDAARAEEIGDVLRRDRAEELAFLGRLPPLLVDQSLDLRA